MTKPKFPTVASTAFALAALVATLLPGAANAQTGERFEVAALKAVRPTLARLVAACDKGDIAAARAADEDFATGWRGVQVYVIMRDRTVFQLEGDLEIKIATALKASQPNMAMLAVNAKALAARYDAFVAVASKLPPLNPLFDDVARLRIARAEMREVDIALRAKDFSKARADLAIFGGKIGSIKPVLMQRAPETWDALTKGVPRLQSELSSTAPDANKCMGYIREMMSKYSRTLTALTREAAQPI